MKSSALSNSNIKAVIFDLDDTLWPVVPVIVHAENVLYAWLKEHAPKAVKKYTIEQLRDKRLALMGTDARFNYDLWALRHTSLREVFGEIGEPIGKADLAMQIFADARNQVTLYDDVLSGLPLIKQRVLMGSISNGFADLEAIGLDHHFHVSLAAHRFGCAKPDPRIFHAACEALECQPEQVLFVGDDLLLDVKAAQRVGMQGVWMKRREHAKDEALLHEVKPDAIVTNIHELLPFFDAS